MKAIVGLGNPGPKYLFTRHNFGFIFLDYLYYNLYNTTKYFYSQKFQGEWARVSIEGKEIFLLKPMTFMNLSGISVKSFSEYNNISPQELLIVYDDIDLPLGKIRLRKKGSSGGHKGMDSILSHLNTDTIPRLRLGIGPKPDNVSIVDFVLGDFTEDEKKIVKEVLKKSKALVSSIIVDGVDKAMSKFNG